jgi:hypothetical protein
VSTIGSAIGGLNAAASFAGAQRTDADSDRNKEVAAERKFQVDRNAALDRALGDVADPDLSTDRDADGRLPYGSPPEPGEERSARDEHREAHRHGRALDAFGERGNMLDVEA